MVHIEKNRLAWHLLLWGSTWFLIIMFLSRSWETPQPLLYRSLPTLVSILVLVTVNVQFLLPQFYFKKKYGLFSLLSLFLIIGLVWILKSDVFISTELAEQFTPPEKFHPHGKRFPRIAMMKYITPLLISFIGTTLIELTHYAYKKERAVISIEKEKLDAEINFLKSQINPHFLFNTINNIYTQTVIKSDEAPENLIRLSEMLRYMLYDSNVSEVPLHKEIEYLENYISFASLKDSRGLNIKINLDKSQPNLMIAPLLFIPFVENAFKHSRIEDINNGFITIDLQIKKNHVEFCVENSIPEIEMKKDDVGGVGLANTNQRLELLYPNQFDQKVTVTDTKYTVELKLNIR